MRLYILFSPFLILSCGNEQIIENVESNEDSTEIEVYNDLVDTNENTLIADTVEAVIQEETNEYDDIDWEEYEKVMTKDYSYVILISTKNYDSALERAKDASEKLGYPLDLRGLHPNAETGLSLPKDVCEGICGGGMVEYPQYLPRNDWGESKYVSVEYSNGYSGFTKGYFIVIVASGTKGDPIVQEALKESRKYYEDAYAKTCGVWMGCGC